MKKLLIQLISTVLLVAFSFDTCCYGLATLPASQNPAIKREILAALQRTQIRYAESEDAIKLLNANNASCLLLSSGKYLVTREVAQDDLRLLRAIIHEDIEAIMQIIAKEDRYKYQGIKELILKYFPPENDNKLPIDLYVNHTVARAFGWLILIERGIILRDEIPPQESAFINAIKPIIMANKHNYFTGEFWELRDRSEKIRIALNNGMRFYQVASEESHDTDREIYHGINLREVEEANSRLARSNRIGIGHPTDFPEYKTQLVRWISEKFGSNISILSIGAGKGDLELALQNAGHSITAIEYYEPFVKEMRAKRVKDVIQGDARAILGDKHLMEKRQKFNLVIFSECIGTIGLNTIDLASKLLKDEGAVLVIDYRYAGEEDARKLREMFPTNRIKPELIIAKLKANLSNNVSVDDKTFDRLHGITLFYAKKEKTTIGNVLQINFPEEVSMLCARKRIGITGASGVIGSALVRRLIRENPEIKLNVLIRKIARQRPAWDNLLKRFPQNINIIEGDLMDADVLLHLVKESDVVFHIALDSRDDFRSQEPGGNDRSREILIANTVPGAVMSSLAAKENKPFIFASSYGIFFHIMKSSKGQRLKEEDVLISAELKRAVGDFIATLQSATPALSERELTSFEEELNKIRDYLRRTGSFSNLSNHQLYAVQKLINEYIIRGYPHAIALRIGNIYGPGDAEGRPIPTLIQRTREGGKQLIPNDRRSYIYVGDVAEAFLRAAVISQKGVLGELDRVISVAHPDVTDSLTTATKIKEALSIATDFEVQGSQMNENLELDLSRMRSILGMPPSEIIPLDKGIRLTIELQPDDVRSIYDIFKRDVDKDRIMLFALYSEDFPFTGESAGINAISGYMKRYHKEVSVDVLDMQLDKIDDIIKEIKTKKPAILGISVKLKTYDRLSELCKRIYEEIPSAQRPLIIIGNALPTYVSDSILKERLPDLVIGLGEGEVSIEDIYLYVQGRMRLEDIRNIVYMDNAGTIRRNKTELMPPECFTMPDRRRTLEFYEKGGIVYAEQSRGCPWGRCTICASSEVLGSRIEEKRWRPLPLEVVMEDLDMLQRMGVEVVRYSDEEFLGRGKRGIERARKFAEEKIRRGNKVRFDIMARVDSVYDEEESEEDKRARVDALRLLKEAGLIKISLGVESFSQAQLRRYAKGITTKEIFDALKIVRDLKIPLGIGFIPCDPLVSLSEIEETLTGLNAAEALMESSVTFNELRVQEGSRYLHLTRKKETETGVKILGPLDMNSLNYPVMHYLDSRVDTYVKALRDLYTRKQLYKIIGCLRIYTQYSSHKKAMAGGDLPDSVSVDSAYNLLFRIRQLDYQLSMELIGELKKSGSDESTRDKIKMIVQLFDERLEKEMLPFLADLSRVNKSGVFGSNRQIDELISAMTEYVVTTHSSSDLHFENLEEARSWIKNEFIPKQAAYRQLKFGRRLAEEHLRAFTAVITTILNQTELAGRVSIMTYGSSAGRFMTENSDTDLCILSDETISGADMLRLQSEIEKGLRSVPGYPWKVSFKPWELVRINMMDLISLRFICGNKGLYDRHITHNPEVLNIVNNRDSLIAWVARVDLYHDYISSPAFSYRLRRFLTQDELPEDIEYGNVKFYRGGIRTAQGILIAAALYSGSKAQFLEEVNISKLIDNGIISKEDAQKFYKALDFLLAAKDALVYGYNMFNEKNIKILSSVLGESREEIREEYDKFAADLIYVRDKIRRAVQQANNSNMGVIARLSKDKDELKRIIDTNSIDLWSTIGLRADLPQDVREYLESRIHAKQKTSPLPILDEVEEAVCWARDIQNGVSQDNAGKRDDIETEVIEKVKSALAAFQIDTNDAPSSLKSFVSSNFSRMYEECAMRDVKKFRLIFAKAVKDYISIRLANISGLSAVIEQACDSAERNVSEKAISRSASATFIPENISFIELHLTNECNQRCTWCSYKEADRRNHLKFEDIDKVAKLKPVEILIVGGGEPVIYRDGNKTFNDAIARLRELLPATKLRLITNGVVIPPGDWQHKIDEVSISFDEATRESYLVHKGVDRFDDVWRNVIDGYLVESPIRSVRVTLIYNAERIADSFLLAEKLWKRWHDLAIAHRISEEKAKNFRFMVFPMANDKVPDKSYEGTILGDAQRERWQKNLDVIKSQNPEFFTFLKEHTNLCTQHMRDLTVPPSEKCWSVSNYVLVGADRVLYPCFAACEACRNINLGSVDQSPSGILRRRQELFNNPPMRCHKGCRPNTTFYGLKSFNLLFEQMTAELKNAEEDLRSLRGDDYTKALEYYRERVNITIAMFRQRISVTSDETEKKQYAMEIDRLLDNLAKFERATLPKLMVNVSFQDPDHLAGGQGWAVLNLCKAQIKQGFEVVWISPCVRGEQPGEYLYLDGKLKVIKIRISEALVSTLYANDGETQAKRRIFGDKFVQYIKEHYSSVDCTIHLHGFIEVPRRAAELKACGYNITSTFHMFLSPRIEATKANEAFLARLKEIEHEAIMANSKIIVNSVGMAEEVKALCPDYKGSIFVVRNGVGDEYFNTPKAHGERGPPVISTYGRISPEKGFDIFIEAAKIVTERRKRDGKEEVRFIIFGNSDDSIKARREYLADMKKRREGFDNIIIVARPEGVHGDEKWGYIDSSTIGVVPSLYEPFGMVIPEYMARGLPIITTLIPGAIDILKSNKLGVTPFGIIADKTAESMANAMEWMLRHPEEIKLMGENAAERAKTYKWSEVLRETMDVYRIKSSILSEEKEKIEYDTAGAIVLITDLLHAQLHENRVYEIKYDISKLSSSQIDIIETYISLLQKRASNPNNIKARPFSSAKGSKESLIAVYCTGKNFNGEGHVDIDIPEGNIHDYLLRVTGMINIALAASNIPANATEEELKTSYGPIIGFIKNQYKEILGSELAVPDSIAGALKVLRYIVLTLPRAYRVPLEKIEEYNRLAKQALISA